MDNSNKKKFNVAFFTRNIEEYSGFLMLKGILKGAKDNNINLITFKGEQLGSSTANIIYDHATNSTLFDGIITWASSDNDKYVSYYKKFNIPIISISLNLNDSHHVVIETYQGMKNGILHLINEHKLRKIAFIRGPEKHIYAQERYQAYVDALKESQIPYDEKLVSPYGEWSSIRGKKCISMFLDERKLTIPNDIEAIVSVNDGMVLSAFNELKDRGIKIPEDISLLGFNDSTEARTNTPSINSVSMPFFQQGETAINMLYKLLTKQKTENKETLFSNFIIRESCKCSKYSDINEIYSLNNQNNKESAKDYINKIIKKNKQKEFPVLELTKNISEKIFLHIKDIFSDIRIISNEDFFKMSYKFVNSFFDDFLAGTNKNFTKTLMEILQFVSDCEGEIESWQLAINILRADTIPHLRNFEQEIYFNNLCDLGRLIILDHVKKTYEIKISLSKLHLNKMQLLNYKLASSYEIEDIINNIHSGLQDLNITKYFIVLYETYIDFKFGEAPPEYSFLKLAYDRNLKIEKVNIQNKFETKKLLPEEFLQTIDNSNLVIYSLNVKNKNLGYIILDYTNIDPKLYKMLAENISNALNNLLLIKQRIDSQEKLKYILTQAKSEAEIITDNSKQIADKVEDISNNMDSLAKNMNEISKRTSEVLNIVNISVQKANKASVTIGEFSKQSEKIKEFVSLITDLAQRIKLLSLNAAIEAARARESGKGFAVVASEVKKLSEATVKSTEEIDNTAKQISNNSSESISAILDVVSVINQIVELVNMIEESISSQANTSNDISKNLSESIEKIKQISEAIKNVAALSENS
jgi:DNA-binding LacI/PurR family transcriptional regulator